jgi:hypothetical protein
LRFRYYGEETNLEMMRITGSQENLLHLLFFDLDFIVLTLTLYLRASLGIAVANSQILGCHDNPKSGDLPR